MNDPRVMSYYEQSEHVLACSAVRGALSALRLTRRTDEDIVVAKARLEEWLAANDGRWVK